MHGEEDGPVPFHYPAQSYQKDLALEYEVRAALQKGMALCESVGDYVGLFAGADNLAGAGGRYLTIRPRGFYAGLSVDY